MNNESSFLTQSKYYSPALNAAIFDGPVKIYFAQHQEDLALHIYCCLQKKLKEVGVNTLTGLKNVYLMIYPTSESFYMSFDKKHVAEHRQKNLVVEESLGDDIVLGIRGPLEEDSCSDVYDKIEAIFSKRMPEILTAVAGA